MKIGDQKPSPPVPGETPGMGGATAPAPEGGFAEELGEIHGTEASAGATVSAADGAQPTGDLESLAAQIERGELDPKDAMHQLVDRVLTAQLGASAPPEVREQARLMVEQTLASDPHLQSLVKRLGGQEG